MKYSKRYIAFTFILALIFVSNFYIYANDSSTLGAFRGAQIDNKVWSPLVAANVNGTTTSVLFLKEYSFSKFLTTYSLYEVSAAVA